MMRDDHEGPSSTEDAAAAPGWVETSLDEILSDIPAQPALPALRAAYLDCIAAIRPGDDSDIRHDRCRIALLRGLDAKIGLGERQKRGIEQRLEALEAEITERT